METQNKFRAKLLDQFLGAVECIAGRGILNRAGAYVYWRTRGENLDDPERNGEYRVLDTVVSEILGSRAVALDVGANIGDWTALFLKKAPQGRAIAFEPVQETYKALLLRHGNDERVNCRNIAVSDRASRCIMRVGGALSGSNSLYNIGDNDGLTEEEITTERGDVLSISENLGTIDYLKIDVEGHEVNVLEGFESTLKQNKIRFVQWEYNKTWIASKRTLREVFQLLVPVGYKLFKIRAKDLLKYHSYNERLENFCYSNWLAVRDSDYEKLSAKIAINKNTQSDW